MIIFGSRGKVHDLGQVEIRHCQTCEKERSFRLNLAYRYFHLYFLFGAVTQKHYSIACEVCRRGWQIEAKKIESKLEKSPIPFMLRFGILVLVSAAVVAAVAGAIASNHGVG